MQIAQLLNAVPSPRTALMTLSGPHSARRPCVQERGVCTFRGRECYHWNTWNRDNMSDYTATVTSMALSRSSEAEVRWAWSGKFGPVPIAGSVVSTLSLNLLTGKVLEHTDDVKVLANPLAQLAYGVRKGLWARRQGARQMGDKARAPAACCLVVPTHCAAFPLLRTPSAASIHRKHSCA